MSAYDLAATRKISFTASGELPLLLGEALVRTESFEAIRRTPQSSRRLRRMMQRVGIDRVPAARSVDVLTALQVTCADCPNVRQCALWQSAGDDDTVIRSFCPNAPTFEALRRITERSEASMRDAVATRMREISREIRERAKREADARLRQLVASHALALAQHAERIEREIAVDRGL
jgi:Family of unknown function (DUF6455)